MKKGSSKRKAGAVRQRFANTITVEPGAAVGALKLKAACVYLGGISVPTLHKLIREGRIEPCRQLRHYLFPISTLEAFLKEGQTD